MSLEKKRELFALNEDSDQYGSDDEDYEHDEFDPEEMARYNLETIEIIQREMLRIVRYEGLPLCEYLTTASVEKFIVRVEQEEID